MSAIARPPLARAEVEVVAKGPHATYRIDGDRALISNPMMSGAVLLALPNCRRQTVRQICSFVPAPGHSTSPYYVIIRPKYT